MYLHKYKLCGARQHLIDVLKDVVELVEVHLAVGVLVKFWQHLAVDHLVADDASSADEFLQRRAVGLDHSDGSLQYGGPTGVVSDAVDEARHGGCGGDREPRGAS